MKWKILMSLAAMAASASAQTPPKADSTKGQKASRPRMSGSMTGYIENPVVGTEVMVQSDAAFHVDAPDQAEFFYAKCGCYRLLTGTPLIDPHSPGPGKGIVTNLNFQEFHTHLEYAPLRRLSVFVEVPARWLQVQAAVGPSDSKFSSSGIGDFRSGLKAAILSSEDRALTFQLRTYSPTGDARLGLGTNHVSIEPAALYSQRTSDRTSVSGQFLFWHPIDGAQGFTGATPPLFTTSPAPSFAGNVITYGLGGSYDAGSWNDVKVTPVLEFVGWQILNGFRTTQLGPVSASRESILNAKFGFRMSRGRHSVYLGYGRALTHDIWYQEIARIEYRFAL